MSEKRVGKLALEDGSVWNGVAFGAEGEAEGELSFETAMSGYQEALTDPNNCGQMLVMTYPEIGNYGVNSDDVESAKIQSAGLIVRNLSSRASNFRSETSLEEYMIRFNKVGLQGIDTRALVRRIRDRGAMKAVLSTLDESDASLVRKARDWSGIAGQNLVQKVATETTYDWDEPLGAWADYRLRLNHVLENSVADDAPLVVVLDFGLRWSFARLLRTMGYRVRVMSGLTTNAKEVLALKPAGILLSNGPGDPSVLENSVKTVRDLLGKVPVMGICLGNLLLGLAYGMKTVKLPFGHRGGQSVIDLATGNAEMTHQNHGFILDAATLDDSLEVTHQNVNDGTIAGIQHKKSGAFGVMYYPKLTEVFVGGKFTVTASHPFVKFHEMMGEI